MLKLNKLMLIAGACLGIVAASHAEDESRKPINLFPSNIFSFNPALLGNDASASRAPVVLKRADYPERWTVAEFNGKKITNTELEGFIEVSKLTDSRKIQLFKQAGGDWDRYLELKADWVYSWWRPSLKQLIYYKILEDINIREGRQRKAFTVTRNEYWDISDKAERDVLEKLLDVGKGIKYAREEYAKFLLETGFPHKSSDTLEEIYFRWKRVQDARIKEQLRVREVQKYEFLMAHPKADPNYFQPIGDIYRLNEEAKKRVDRIFARTDLTRESLSQILSNDPLAFSLVKGIKSYSLSESSMKYYYETNRSKFNSAIQSFKRLIGGDYATQKIEKILHYEGLAHDFAGKYDRDELKARAEQAKNKFVQSNEGDYQYLMLGRLYEMASVIRENGIEKGPTSREITRLVEEALSRLNDSVDKAAFYTAGNSTEQPIANLIDERLRQFTGFGDLSHEYLARCLDMAIWMIKFDFKNLASRDSTIFKADIRDYKKYEAQQKLEDYYLVTKYEQNLGKYRTGTLKRKYRHSVQVNPSGEFRWSTGDSINFIFE